MSLTSPSAYVAEQICLINESHIDSYNVTFNPKDPIHFDRYAIVNLFAPNQRFHSLNAIISRAHTKILQVLFYPKLLNTELPVYQFNR